MPLTLTMTRDLCCTSDLLVYLAWFLYQDTLAPAGHPAACQASYPATASLTGMLVGPGDRRPGRADQRLTFTAAAFGQAAGRPRRVHPPRTWPCGWALHQRRPPGTSPSCAIWVVDAMSPERLGRPGKTPIGSSHPALT